MEITTYSTGSKVLHWTIALLVILMLSVSFFMGDVADVNKPFIYMIHKSIGLTILFLMLIRIFWIIKWGRPRLPIEIPLWQKLLSRSVQYALYLTLIIMPLTGWIMSVAANRTPSYFGLFLVNFPGIKPSEALAKFLNQSHTVIAWIIISLLILHILGALKNHFYHKNEVLVRMLPFSENKY